MTIQSKYKHLYARHLNSALVYDQVDFYIKNPQFWKARFKDIPLATLHKQVDGFIDGIPIFPTIEQLLESCITSSNRATLSDWQLTTTVVLDAIQTQAFALFDEIPKFDKEFVHSKMDYIKNNPAIKRAFDLKKLVLDIHDQLTDASRTNVYPVELKAAPCITVNRSWVTVTVSPKVKWTLPYDFLLVVLDKLEAQLAFLVYITLADKTREKQHLDYYKFADSIYRLLDQAYSSLGNTAIRFFKMLEPLCVGLVLARLDPDTNDAAFLQVQLDSLHEKYPETDFFTEQFISLCQSVLDQDLEFGIPIVLEQYGQEKLHYYPIVDQEAGLLKMYAYGTDWRPCSFGEADALTGDFVKEYIHAYYMREGHLPAMVHCPDYHPGILDIIAKGIPPSLRLMNLIPRREWAKVIFMPHQAFDYFPEIMDLLDDKSITPHQARIYQLFADDALKVINQCKIRPYVNTKLILEILSRPIIDIREFYEAVELLGYIPANWAVIQLMAKERELKIEARDFSILTFEVRMMCSTCEKNIANSILKYFPQQSMTYSGAELRQKLDTIINLKSTADYVWVFFHVDLEQWNYTFRLLLQQGFCHILNTIFGVKHFEIILRVFQDSLLFSANKFAPPGSPDQFTQWTNHGGGNQGIFQKLWTIITILIIRNVMHSNQYDHVLTGSGDNQVIAIRLRRNAGLAGAVATIRTQLAEAFEKVGLSVKIQETWYSDSLVAYQRKYYYKGRQTEGGIKPSTRAYSGGTDVYCGLNMMVMTAMNGGVSINESTSDPIVGIMFAYLEVFSSLILHPKWKKLLPADPKILAAYSYFTSDLGYLPFLPLISFLYSGHKDTLSSCLALVRKIWDKNHIMRFLLSGMISFQLADVTPNSNLQLVLDPYSLNIKKPATTEAILKTAVEKHLKEPGVVRNKRIVGLMGLLQPKEQQAFADAIMKISPVHLSLNHSLFQYSLVGQTAQMVNRFTKISTLVRWVDMNNSVLEEKSFSERIEELDSRNLKFIRSRANQRLHPGSSFIHHLLAECWGRYEAFCKLHQFATECTFSARLFLVSYTYKKDPQLIMGPYLPSPIEQLKIVEVVTVEEYPHSVQIAPAVDIPMIRGDADIQKGPFSLYLGSRTKDPVKNIKLTTLDGVEAGLAVRMLLKMHSWLSSQESDRKILDFVEHQVELRVPDLMSVVKSLTSGTAGGTFEHRFDVPGNVSGAYINSTTLISSWYQISTNHAADLQRGEEDRYIFFQELFQMIFASLRFCHSYTHKIFGVINWDCCSYKIPQAKFSAPSDLPVSTMSQHHHLAANPAQLKAIFKEARHFTKIKGLSTMNKLSKGQALAAYVAYQFCTKLKGYQLGQDVKWEQQAIGLVPQSIYNVTVLRSLDLKELLRDIFYTGTFMRCFGPVSNLRKALKWLETTIQLSSTLQEMSPYQPLIEGLITAGHLTSLALLAKMAVKWDFEGNRFGLLTLFLRALYNTGLSSLQSQEPGHLAIEAKRSNYHWESVWTFYRRVCPPFRKWCKANPVLKPYNTLGVLTEKHPYIHPVVVVDIELLLEYGRNKPSVERTLQPSYRKPVVRTVYPLFLTRLDILPLVNMEADYVKPHVFTDSINSAYNSTVEIAEEIKDYWHHIGRWQSQASGGRLKLLEILALIDFNPNPITHIVSLAEGPGSYLSSLLHLCVGAEALYVSLLTPTMIPHCMSSKFIPPECICPCNVSDRIQHIPELNFHYGDLTKPFTWEAISRATKSWMGSSSVVTWDMEGHSDLKTMALMSLGQWLMEFKPQWVIIKLFLSDFDRDKLSTIEMICHQYMSQRLIKPVSSEVTSTELFLVLSNPSRKFEADRHLDMTAFSRRWVSKIDGVLVENWVLAQLRVAEWSADLNTCPINFPSTGSNDLPQHHPILGITQKVLRVYWAWVRDYSLLGMTLERGQQHMTQSVAKGSDATTEELLVDVSFIRLLLALIEFSGITLTHEEVSAKMVQNLLMILQQVPKDLGKLDKPASQTRYLKLIGEAISSDKEVHGEWLCWMLTMINRFGPLLPSHWKIRDLVELAFVNVAGHSIQSYLDVDHNRPILFGHPGFFSKINDVLGGLPHKEQHNSWDFQSDYQQFVYWMNLINDHLLVVEPSVNVLFVGDKLSIPTLLADSTGIKYALIWSISEQLGPLKGWYTNITQTFVLPHSIGSIQLFSKKRRP